MTWIDGRFLEGKLATLGVGLELALGDGFGFFGVYLISILWRALAFSGSFFACWTTLVFSV